jgi:hypothetical protein
MSHSKTVCRSCQKTVAAAMEEGRQEGLKANNELEAQG